MYEHVPVEPGSLEPHLWDYQPHISLLHVRQALQQQKTKCPILKQFLEEVSVLAGVSYLQVSHCPSICVCVCVSVFLPPLSLFLSLPPHFNHTSGTHTACNSSPPRHREAAAQALQYISPSTGSQRCPGKDRQPVH